MDLGLMVCVLACILNSIKTNKLYTYIEGELVYRDPTGGLSILVVESLSTRILMTNSTFVSEPHFD